MPILAKDEGRQRQIMEKAKLDASSAEARSIGPSTPTQASRGLAKVAAAAAHKGATAGPAKAPAGAPGAGAGKPPSQALAGKGGAGAAAAAAASKPTPTAKFAASAAASPGPAPGAPKKINMVIQSIPPFRGGSAGSATRAVAPGAAPPARQGSNGASPAPLNLNTAAAAAASRSPQATPMSPNTLAAKQLNAHASSFRPNPKANAFTPVISGLLLLTVASVL